MNFRVTLSKFPKQSSEAVYKGLEAAWGMLLPTDLLTAPELEAAFTSLLSSFKLLCHKFYILIIFSLSAYFVIDAII